LAVREFLKDSDKICAAAIDSVALDARASRGHLEVLSEESRTQHRVLEAQVDKLTNMMQTLLTFRAGIADKEGGDQAPEEHQVQDAPSVGRVASTYQLRI
jgi:hypothetical protein